MAPRTVWITGSAGLIGSHLSRLAARHAPDCEVIPLSRAELDLTDFDAVTARFRADAPTHLIHCAALSQSGACEEQPALAQTLNVDVTGFLARLFAARRMVFFSTDLVFNGRQGGYAELDPPDPLGVYARTKLEAEQRVRALPDHLVLRTSLNGGVSPSGNRGFNEALCQAWRQGRTTPLFVDEFRSPIPARVTARAAWELTLSDTIGILHLAGAERLSRVQIGELIAARHPELQARIRPTSLRDYTGPPRAADCSLNCSRAQSILSFPLPGLSEWLRNHPKEPF